MNFSRSFCTTWLWGAWLLPCLACATAWGQAGGTLPWTQKGEAGKPVARRAQSARELLVNLTDSQVANFRDGQPVSVDEDEPLYRILYRLPMFGAYDTQRLSKPLDAAALRATPDEARMNLFRVEGRAVGVERIAVLPELTRRMGFDHFWRVRIELSDSADTAVVSARWIPAAWRDAESLNERTGAYALFLKAGEATDNAATLYFACDRLEWFPTQTVEGKIAPDHVLLSQLGFDFARLADLDGRDARPLGQGDQECFYQMLLAAGKAEDVQLKHAQAFELAPVLTKPAAHHGELFRVTGRVKRVTPVEVDDRELQERFGFDRYYQLDLVIGLGNQEVRLAKSADDKDAPVISQSFPVVACIRDLPTELQGLVAKRDVNEEVELDAFYFRLWSFQSGLLNKFAVDQGTSESGEIDAKKVDAARRRQPSPLFIAARVRPATRDDSQRSLFGAVMGTLIVGIIGALFAANWYAGAADRRARERLRRTVNGP